MGCRGSAAGRSDRAGSRAWRSTPDAAAPDEPLTVALEAVTRLARSSWRGASRRGHIRGNRSCHDFARAVASSQLYLAAIVVDKTTGKITTYPAVYVWNQNRTPGATGNGVCS